MYLLSCEIRKLLQEVSVHYQVSPEEALVIFEKIIKENYQIKTIKER